MKKTVLYTATMLLLIGLLFTGMRGFAQAESTSPAYKRFPTVPPMQLMLVDSTAFSKEKLNKKKATMIMLFSPECEHCKHETEELVKRIDDFKNVQIVMATPMPFDKMKEYYEHYGLAKYPNIKMGQDAKFMLPVFFNIKSFPFLAFYNKKQELISVFEGNLGMDQVLAELRK